MLTATSRMLAAASLFSVVLRFVVHFLVSPPSQFVFSTLLVVHAPNRLQCRNRWEVGGQPCASRQPRRHRTDGWTRLACDSPCTECSLVRCTSSLVRASEVKPHTSMYFGWHRQRRNPVCMFPTNINLDNHQKLCSPHAGGRS